MSCLNIPQSRTKKLTLSRMTRGPFTPPIVLYVIRGLTTPIRGSPAAEGISAAEDAGLGLVALPVMEYAETLSDMQFQRGSAGGASEL
jgi:hypothetical protein